MPTQDAISHSKHRRRKSDSWANDFFFGASYMILGAILNNAIAQLIQMVSK